MSVLSELEVKAMMELDPKLKGGYRERLHLPLVEPPLSEPSPP
jgi:hypothetical protein